ncbi:MAG: gamma-glutamylcyclotransferase [Sedimentisphaerales bacterium]|nr:gamma-glutamylcyclotransferase [Sedimentisphaerales bacterium]
MQKKKYNLFIYGSLRDPSILKSVCGLSFSLKPSNTHSEDSDVLFAELAMLPGYRRVSPDNVYYYAVANPNTKIEGFIIYDMPASALAEIDKYEGLHYDRETIKVNTANGPVEAQAYLASHKSMRKRFGDRFHVNLIHELWLRKRIEKFFRNHTRPGEKSIDADIERRARRELLGTTERDLVISHLGSDAVSDYYLEHELDRPCPSIKYLYNEPDAAPYIDNYIALVVKQVLLNQLEQTIQSKYRYELERLSPTSRYFTRSLGLLAALRMINANSPAIGMIIKRCLESMPGDGTYDLIDYVKYAVSAADSIFDPRVARSELEIIKVNRQPGLVPMGVELELSNLGFRAVLDPDTNVEYTFDGFKYFHDFRLDILSWKLGGYIDDHSGSAKFRRRGFLELAPGRLNVLGELSKPATSDPWVMNQLIREIIAFYPVKPHSLHISFQVRRHDRAKSKILPLSFIKCLLALGGGTQQNPTGGLWVSRMAHDEIKQHTYGEELVFSRLSRRRWYLGSDDITKSLSRKSAAYVQQYKFIRLEERANYEPLIMALKGLQLAYNPGDYLTVDQLIASIRLRQQYEELKKWSSNPTEINRSTKGRFLDAIYKGLTNEAHHRPYHKPHYIDWAIGAIDVQLRLFNKQIELQSAYDQNMEVRDLIDRIKPARKPLS